MTAARPLCILALFSLVGGAPPARSAPSADRTAALYRASYQLEAKGDTAGALARMVEIRAASGASYFAVVRTAWLQYLKGDHAGSVTSYREAIRLEPRAVEPKLGLTLPLLALKKWRDLERACRDVLALDPNDPTARARLAHALYFVGSYPDAATLYRKLTADYPAVLDHQTGLGWTLLRMGRRAEAHRLFHAVLAVSPDNLNAKAGLAAP